MHYYEFNIKTFQAATAHLTNEEEIAYRRLLDLYYDTERPIPNANPTLSRRLRVDAKVLETVLYEFFCLTENGWENGYCNTVIAKYHAFVDKQKLNGARGGRSRKPSANPKEPNANPTLSQPLPTSHSPLPTNHVEERKKNNREKKQNKEIPNVFLITEEMLVWAKDLGIKNIENQTELFKDHHKANGSKMKDWVAAWRKWMRNCVDWKSEDRAVKGNESYNINNDPNVRRENGWFIPG